MYAVDDGLLLIMMASHSYGRVSGYYMGDTPTERQNFG